MVWRRRWAAAQITPVLASSFVWLLISGLVPAIWLAGLVGVVAVLVAARTSRAGLWVRFGVSPSSAAERDTVVAALVPVASLRGRGQPRVWVGSRGVDVCAVGPRHLLISRRLLVDVAGGRIGDEQVCAAACFRLGQSAPAGSAVVRTVELFCTPWWAVARLAGAVARTATGVPLVRFAWAIRPAVFLLAAVNVYATGPAFWREVVVASVVAVLVLTYTTPVLRAAWEIRLQELGDARVVADGFGAVWAGMLAGSSAEPATSRRVERLTRAQSGGQPHIEPEGAAMVDPSREQQIPAESFPRWVSDRRIGRSVWRCRRGGRRRCGPEFQTGAADAAGTTRGKAPE